MYTQLNAHKYTVYRLTHSVQCCRAKVYRDKYLFIDRVAADFFGQYCRIVKKGLGRSWDFLVGTVWLHIFLCLHEYILTEK